MGYILGFLFAYGSIPNTSESSRTYYISFSNTDLSLLEEMKNLMNSSHIIYKSLPRIMKPRNQAYISKTVYVLRIGSRRMHQDLLRLGLEPRKSRTMHLPYIPDQYFSYFLRGYFDGDGCINTYLSPGRKARTLKVLFTSGSRTFLEALSQHLAAKLAISKMGIYKSLGAYNLACSGMKAIRILNYMYYDLENAPFMKRKYEKYRTFINNQIGPRLSRLVKF